MFRRLKCFTTLLILSLGVVMMAGCDGENEVTLTPGAQPPPAATPPPTPAPETTPPPAETTQDTAWVFPEVIEGEPPTPLPWPLAEDVYERRPVLLQLTPLTPGEQLVILHTNKGDVKVRLFPQVAPLAVQNFLTHAQNGFYDGLIFHRVIPGFMIQGGCSLGTGTGGGTIWGTGIGPEHNYDVWHFHGALAMAQSGAPNSIGSQFYIVHSSSLDGGFRQMFQGALDGEIYEVMWESEDGRSLLVGDFYSREFFEHFLEVGGTPFLDFPFNNSGPNFGHTVFGHVVTGMDVVDAIANVERNAYDRPLEDVIIERTSVLVYQG